MGWTRTKIAACWSPRRHVCRGAPGGTVDGSGPAQTEEKNRRRHAEWPARSESSRFRRAGPVGSTRSQREIISVSRRPRHCDEKYAPLDADPLRSAVKTASRGRTTKQVAGAAHVHPHGRLTQLLSTRGKEPAEHAARAQLLQASPPALCALADPDVDTKPPGAIRAARGVTRNCN